MYQSTSSPFRSNMQSQQMNGGNSNPQQPFQANQQQQSSSNQPQQSFAGPQFGGGSMGWTQNGSSGNMASHGGMNGSGGGSGYGQGSFGYGNQQGYTGMSTSNNGNNMQQNNGNNGQGGNSNNNNGDAPRHYLPGYLLGGAMNQSQSTPPSNNDDTRTWDSPASRGSVAGSSPASRFGGQSLFGPRDGTPSRSPKGLFSRELPKGQHRAAIAEMEEDAPPVESLGEMEANDSMNSPGKPSGSSYPSSSAQSQTPDAAASSSTTPTRGTSIHVFGFPSSAASVVLAHFAQFGEIISSSPSSEGGNWMTITYAESWSASRAVRRNGEILGGVLMVGTKLVEDESIGGGSSNFGRASPNLAAASTPSQQQQPSLIRASTSNTPSGIGRPVPLMSAASAFKQPTSTPTRLGFFSGTPAKPQQQQPPQQDRHASLFAEKNRQAMLVQGEAQQGVLGKLSEMVFGW